MNTEEEQHIIEQEKRWLLREKYAGKETNEYHADLKRLQAGKPVDYLIGHREFLNCHIDLSYEPLIPRNETEYWTQQIIENYKNPTSGTKSAIRVLDMCAGSGCIGIAILHHLPHTQVDFVEKKPEFIAQIQKNLDLNNINPSRYTVYQSDMFTNIQESNSWDIIVANPPYIARDRQDTVQESVHNHEDHESLYADDDGLYFIKKILTALPERFAFGGECYIEYDPWQTELIEQYLQNNHSTFDYHIIRDQFDKNRVLVITHR